MGSKGPMGSSSPGAHSVPWVHYYPVARQVALVAPGAPVALESLVLLVVGGWVGRALGAAEAPGPLVALSTPVAN